MIEEHVYTISEMARLFGVNTQTVIRWDKKLKFPHGSVIRTPGGQRRFRSSLIDPMLRDIGIRVPK